MKGLTKLVQVDPGVEPAGVLSFEVSLPRDRYPDGERVTAFHSELATRLSVLPGVQSIGAIDKLPLLLGRWLRFFTRQP